jgi:putative lipoprotein
VIAVLETTVGFTGRIRASRLLRILGISIAMLQSSGCAPPSTDDSNRLPAAAREPARMSEVSGLATYRERIALPPDAVFEATLEDVSRADAPSVVLGSARLEPAGQPPFRFSIGYDTEQLEAGHTYAIRARVTHEERLLFTTDSHYPLPAQGEQLDLLLVRTQSPRASTSATLENTHWKLIALGNDPISVGEPQRVPFFILHSENQQVEGFGGCNRFMGGYSLSNSALALPNLASTMMACVDGMQYEHALHTALRQTSSWRIEGERLTLLDAAGKSLATFEKT